MVREPPRAHLGARHLGGKHAGPRTAMAPGLDDHGLVGEPIHPPVDPDDVVERHPAAGRVEHEVGPQPDHLAALVRQRGRALRPGAA